jgi:FHIPEP family
VSATSPVRVSVQLRPSLYEFAGTPLAAMTARALDSDLTALAERIGVSGEVKVDVSPGSTTRPVCVEIGERTLPYPPVTMLRAWLSVTPSEMHPQYLVEEEGEGYPCAWLDAYVSDKSADWRFVAAWLERVVYQAVLERPSLLIGPDEIRDCAAEISSDEVEAAGLVLPLLDLGVSVADRAVLARELEDGREVGRSLDDTLEAAFSELRTHRLEVHVHPATLAELAPGRDGSKVSSVYEEEPGSTAAGIFQNMEETFFLEFGFRLPDIVWVPSPELLQRSVAIRIGEWWAPPVPFPSVGWRLVNAHPEALTDLAAQPAVHPIYGTPCALIEDRAESKDRLEAASVVTWGPVDFVVLNLYGELIRHPERLLGIEEVEYELARLEDFDFDRVVAASLAHFSLGEMTRIFRAGLAEGVSLRDLPAILERLVEFDVVRVPQEGLTVLDDRLPVSTPNGADSAGLGAHYRYLRRRLARNLSAQHVWYGNTLVAYELASDLDRRAASWGTEPPSGPEAIAFRDDVWRTIRSASRLRFGQVLITSDSARAGVRSVLAPELPALTVLSRDEVAPEIEVSLLGTIG